MNFDIWRSAILNLWKNKSFTLISLIGLSVGFVGFMLVTLFVRYEFSWDKSHLNYDRIYRVQRHYTKVAHAFSGNDISPHTASITASLLERYPEFEKVTVIREEPGRYLSIHPEHQVFDETGIAADHNFLDVFTYHLLEGDEKSALIEPFSIMVSRSMADRLFGDKPAMGKNVILEKKFNFKVTGVYEDLPANSSQRPAYIFSFTTLKRTDQIERDESWHGSMMTYALLFPGIDEAEAESLIRNAYAEFEGRELEELELCPLSLVYLNHNGNNDLIIILSIFGIIGLFILLMSVFNYVNFAIATASTRGKEIALRKISGAVRSSLVAQLLGETLLLSLAASVAALVAVVELLPVFNTIVNTGLSLELVRDWQIIVILISGALLIGLISGIYPARVISSRNVVKLVKEGVFNRAGSRFDIRKILVTIQFTISIFLICLTLFFVAQIDHFTKMDMGFNRSNLLYAEFSTVQSDQNFDQLRNRLIQHPGIKDASMSTTLPFVKLGGGMVNWEGAAPDDKILYRPNWVSYDFIENMDLHITVGRDFSMDFPGDLDNSCIINEAALSFFGWENPIGKKINDNRWTVVGVVENYNLNDIHNPIEAAVLLLSDGQINGSQIITFRYKTGRLEEVRQYLTQEFELLFPNDPFEFRSMDTAIVNEFSFKIYQSVKRSISFFSSFIILLAIISLLSMVSYSIARRTKEIGIRKINGSSVTKLFLLLNRDYFILLGISLTVALPLVFLAYRALPGNYKIPPSPWMPISAVFILAAIILLTTGIQTYRAARRNPVEALRYE